MGTMKLELHFAWSSSPLLLETKFCAGESAPHSWTLHSPHARAPLALAALGVHTKVCRKPLDDEAAVTRLFNACREVSRNTTDLKWPHWWFGDGALLKRLLVFNGRGKLRTVTLSRELLSPEDITIVLDGRIVAADDRRLLQRLRAGLLDSGAPRAEARRGELPPPASQLVRRIRDRLDGPARRASFVVGEREGEVPRLAAKRLLEVVTQHATRGGKGPLTIGISGGLLQQFVLYELSRPALARPLASSVRVVALNRMRADDWRAERSAAHLAFDLVKRLSMGVDVVLPPLSNHPRKLSEYRRAVRSCKFFMLSGGGARASFISEYLRQHGEALPDHAVGDLAGHPISASGRDAATRRVERLLAPLNCQPSLTELHQLATRGSAEVMLVADAVPGNHAAPPSTKGRVVRAALLAGLVNSVVLSRRLAEEVAHSLS